MASIRKRKDSYQITVSLGRDTEGKQIIETTTYRPEATTPRAIEKEVDQFAKDFEKRVREGKYLDGEKVSFTSFVETWERDWAANHLTQKTLDEYKSALTRRAVPAFGHMKMAKIKAATIQKLIVEMNNEGKAPATVHRTVSAIRSVFRYAYRMEVIQSNPVDRCELPKMDADTDIHYWTLAQAQRFLAFLDEGYMTTHKAHTRTLDKTGAAYSVPEYTEHHNIPLQLRVFFTLAIYGGFRRGELLALTWEDVDFETNTISITKSVSKNSGGTTVKGPKTESAVRDIVLPSSCFTLLKQWKTEEQSLSMRLGSKWAGMRGRNFDCNRIFIQDDGTPMGTDTPYQRFKSLIETYNRQTEATAKKLTTEAARKAKEAEKLPSIRLHDLRHTSATLLISENVNIATVSKRLGHSKVSTTVDIYTHALAEKDRAASDKLEELFASGL